MKSLAAISLGLILSLAAFSQTRVVKGKITAFNQYPVQNLVVTSKKGKAAVKTDSLGQFELVCKKKDVILVKAREFEPLNKRVSAREEYITANLIFKDSEKNRESVIGLGYMNPGQLSYAVAHLAHENNDFCNYSNIFNLIMVKFPEVDVKLAPGGGAQGVYIRGKKSFTLDTEAVYEVDGMRVAEISFINPCEVASIDILKSGGTAVYGTQAVNGVVIIRTKGFGNR